MNQKNALTTALSALFANPIAPQLYQTLDKNNTGNWYLIGTDGCHLCDEMDLFLQNNQQRLNLPPIIRLELLDFELNYDKALMECLSPFIPILVTPKGFLCYPFGIMDIITLYRI